MFSSVATTFKNLKVFDLRNYWKLKDTGLGNILDRTDADKLKKLNLSSTDMFISVTTTFKNLEVLNLSNY